MLKSHAWKLLSLKMCDLIWELPEYGTGTAFSKLEVRSCKKKFGLLRVPYRFLFSVQTPELLVITNDWAAVRIQLDPWLVVLKDPQPKVLISDGFDRCTVF